MKKQKRKLPSKNDLVKFFKKPLVLVVTTAIVIGASVPVQLQMYDYFFTDPAEIVVVKYEHYAINTIKIRKRASDWKVYIWAINLEAGESPNHNEYQYRSPSTSKDMAEIMTFTGNSIEEVYTKAVSWIKLMRIQ